VPAPHLITSLSPNSGIVGTHVLISGSNLTDGGFFGVVTFNGAIATTVYSQSPTAYLVAVPVGATTGPVLIEFPDGNSNSLTFTVLTPPVPTITSLTPSVGPTGIHVVIAGTNFGTSQGASTVTFNGVLATVTSWSDTSIGVTVPSTAMTGPVIVTVGGVASNSSTFTVTAPSNGGMPGPLNLLLIPAQNFNTPVMWTLDPTNFNDPSNGGFYNWKVEDVIAGRTPTCNRIVITYRDLGVAIITATLSGVDQNTKKVVTNSQVVTLGTAAASGKLVTQIVNMSLTAQNLQFSVTRAANAGPASIVKVLLEGRVEKTAYS